MTASLGQWYTQIHSVFIVRMNQIGTICRSCIGPHTLTSLPVLCSWHRSFVELGIKSSIEDLSHVICTSQLTMYLPDAVREGTSLLMKLGLLSIDFTSTLHLRKMTKRPFGHRHDDFEVYTSIQASKHMVERSSAQDPDLHDTGLHKLAPCHAYTTETSAPGHQG